MAAALLAQVLAQQLPSLQIEDAYPSLVPLDSDLLSDEPGGRAVIRARDLDAAVEMHGAHAVLEVSKRRHGQRS